jgi:hypothetical protein
MAQQGLLSGGFSGVSLDPPRPLFDETSYMPQQFKVDEPTMTVSGQLDKLLKGGGTYIERAKAGAADTANRRGLLNSSMAAGAGEAAAIDAALPIAQADASLHGNVGLQNQQATNQALQFGASSLRDTALQKLRGDQATQLANIEASYKTLVQSSDSAAKLYQQTVDAINKTLTSADLTPEAKDNAIARQTELLQTGLGIIGKIGDLDLTSLLNFSSITGNATPANAVVQTAPASGQGSESGFFRDIPPDGGDGE